MPSTTNSSRFLAMLVVLGVFGWALNSSRHSDSVAVDSSVASANIDAKLVDRDMPADEHQVLTALATRPYSRVAFCFAEGTPPEEVEYYYQMVLDVLGPTPRYWLGPRWPGAQGNPTTVTWSLVPDGTVITDSTGGVSNLFAQMDSKFSSQGGRAVWVNRIQQCFDRWQEITGISFTRITSGGNDWDDGASWPNSGGLVNRGTIRICGRTLSLNGTLAYTYYPGTGDMLIDMAESWGNTTNQNRYLRDTVMHELGHALGVDHICSGNSSQLMEPFINTSFDGPQLDDLRAVMRHYGDIYEPNNTTGAATDIGLVEIGSPVALDALPPPVAGLNPINTSILSMDANGEEDYFKFTVAGARVGSVVITPRGSTYDDQAQNANGSCPSCCVNTNSLAIADLNVQIIDTDGSTVLGTADVAAAGSAESLTGITLPAAGDYFVRVYEGNTPTQSQLYELDVSVEAVPCQDPAIDPIADASSVCSVAYASPTPTASGTGPFTWSLGGSPPGGMVIDSNTGVVSWPNPIASATPYTVTVQADSQCGGGSDSASFQLTVAPGDFDGDGQVTTADIPDFVDHLIGVLSATPCAVDVNLNSQGDALDIQYFIDSM